MSCHQREVIQLCRGMRGHLPVLVAIFNDSFIFVKDQVSNQQCRLSYDVLFQREQEDNPCLFAYPNLKLKIHLWESTKVYPS